MKNIIIIILVLIICSEGFSTNILWKKVFDNESLLYIGIDNADSNYAMAVAQISGPWRAILKTTNAGDSWSYVYRDSVILADPIPSYPYDISYPTRDFCIIGCDSSYFLKTTDGGVTWKEYKIDIPYTVYGFNDIDMFDENHGVMKSTQYLAISNDGFKTWDTLSAPGGFYIMNVEMAAPNSICVLSRDIDGSPDFNERFFRSDDGGKTWDEYEHPDYRVPKELQFVDSLVGYEVGGKSTGHGQQKYELVFKTTDGGRSWENLLDTVIQISFGLQKLDFYDKDNGIVVGQFGAIFWTHDGGESWIFDSSGVVYDKNPATMNVCYIRKDRAIIADFHGRIFISYDTTTDVVEEIPNGDDFVIYPNPAIDKIKIRFKDEFINSTQLQIFNSYGQEIINQSNSTLNTQHSTLLELDVSLLPSGVYFVVINENGIMKKRAFVVMR